MKQILKTVVVVLFATITMSLQAQTQKIGYINSNELLEMIPGRDTVEAKIVNYKKSLEEQLIAMQTELQTKYTNYQSTAATMSDLIKKSKENEIRDLETRIQEFQQTAQLDFQKKSAEFYQPILESADNAIKQVAKEKGFTYIIDSGSGALLFFENGINIMNDVKLKLGIQ